MVLHQSKLKYPQLGVNEESNNIKTYICGFQQVWPYWTCNICTVSVRVNVQSQSLQSLLLPISYLLPSLLPPFHALCLSSVPQWLESGNLRTERTPTDRCRSEGKRCGRLPGAVSLRRLSMLRVPSESNRTGVSFRGRRRRCWSPGDKSWGCPGASPQGDKNVAFNVRALKKPDLPHFKDIFVLLGVVSSLLLDWCRNNRTGECF